MLSICRIVVRQKVGCESTAKPRAIYSFTEDRNIQALLFDANNHLAVEKIPKMQSRARYSKNVSFYKMREKVSYYKILTYFLPVPSGTQGREKSSPSRPVPRVFIQVNPRDVTSLHVSLHCPSKG